MAKNRAGVTLAYPGTCCPRNVCPPHRNPEHDGECSPEERKPEDCDAACMYSSDPVCDENDITHENECKFEQLNCLLRRAGKPEILLRHYGECQPLDVSTSPPDDDLSNSVEGSGFDTKKETAVESDGRNVEMLHAAEKQPGGAHIGNMKLQQGTDDKRAVKARAIPSLFLDDVDTLSQAEQAALGLKPSENSEVIASSVERDLPVVATHSEDGFYPTINDDFLLKVGVPSDSAESAAEEVLEKSISSTVPPKAISVSAILQPFDLTQPCSAAECDKTKSPVCDSNNRTHKNMCLFKFFACKVHRLDGTVVELAHIGECRADTKTADAKCPPCPVTKSDVFVCDNLNKTHDSLCALARFNYLQRAHKEEERVLVHIGRCHSRSLSFALKDEQCPAKCSSEHRPVCDTQGNTHKNLCHFQKTNCLLRKKGRRAPMLFELKPCAEVFNTSSEAHHSESDASKASSILVSSTAKMEKQRPSTSTHRTPFECPPPACTLEGLPLNNGFRAVRVSAKNSSATADAGQFQERMRFSARSLYGCQRWDKPFHSTRGELSQNALQRGIQDLSSSFTENPKSRIKECPSHEKPVCGSNFVTYTNLCRFNKERCKDESLSVLFYGAKSGADAFPVNCPSACDNIYAPVCGSDDITYTNLCHLKSAQCRLGATIGLAYKGECCNMECPNNFSPVCDDQGITHQNLCFFGRERCIVERITGRNITIDKFDVCGDNACDKECPKTYKPICASNGETIVNECHLDKLNCFLAKKISSGTLISKLYNGECCTSENCDYEFSPVCDSMGETHANECVFRRNACLQRRQNDVTITIQYKGQCCNRQCEPTYVPVCDGIRTHENICRFKIAQCEAERHGHVLTLAYAGECCTLPTGKCERSGSVCDSDGQTHINICHFQQKRCIMNKSMKKTLTVVHPGECCTIEACHKGDSAPVCDTNGGTHATKCHFQNTKCIHDKMHPNNPINLAYNGACCSNNCDNIPDEPVCDQHGNMYRNRCQFKYKACERRRRL
ncbi:Kazal-type serine protease inhibitor domain protein [Ancylostoma duodenale]|uniref:Kazal-type serine protease inhibitor domain protein n=1 Tax=Ancylostoma duodenale TaxID=51022 RepID=A0A0C2GSU2_9BILA|nr:Kazal-type serine protease inhibitor domain protein [Ancylostoma duodenale]